MSHQNNSDPSRTLHLSQKSPSVLANAAPGSQSFPFSLLGQSETSATWADYEDLFQACLTAGDDKSAYICLEKLTQRFGTSNTRVMGLRGLYQEAIANGPADLESVLQSYEMTLEEDPMNVVIHKRSIALLKSLNRPQEAISALVNFVETNTTDAEAWCELSSLYQSQGMSAQAIFCIEEALLIAPNAWNLHARLGEIEYGRVTAGSESGEASQKHLAHAIQRFSRSIELCDDYLRGYYGLKLASHRLLKGLATAKLSSPEILSSDLVSRLHDLATSKLQHIVKSRERYDDMSSASEAELIAAEELLGRSR